jgi:long-chain acyl-CoA synthetase
VTALAVLEPALMDADARRAAGWLHGKGLRAGDRLAVIAPNHPHLLALTHGALRAGIIPVIVKPSLAASERAFVLENCEPALVVERPQDAPWRDARAVDLPELPLGRPMFYTSGTTGWPKGVWGGVLAENLAQALAEDEEDLWAPEKGETFLVCSPLSHSAGHRAATAALLAGAKLMLLERFDSETVVRALAHEGVTGTFLVPTHLRRIFALGDPAPPRNVRRVLHAGESCPEPLKRRALEWLGTRLWEFYGSTEGQFTAISGEQWLAHPGSVGRARAGRRLEIAAPDREGVGTVFVSAPSFARWEYWRDEGRTAAAWRKDSFTAGDMGRLDAGGYLFLASRRDDLIISGGVNVYPAEVERILLEHPAVHEAAIFGVADPEWGERVCAAVVVPEARAGEIRAWAHARLDGPQRPRELLFVDELPHTDHGKLDRAALRALARAEERG